MYQVEHTDTFAGEANYCWVNRHALPDGLTRLQLVRRAKALTGLTGVRSLVHDCGGTLEIRPIGLCQVVFVTWVESEET